MTNREALEQAFGTHQAKKHVTQLVYGDLVKDGLDGGRFRRFVRWAGGSAIVLMDRDTLDELADYRHPSQVEVA